MSVLIGWESILHKYFEYQLFPLELPFGHCEGDSWLSLGNCYVVNLHDATPSASGSHSFLTSPTTEGAWPQEIKKTKQIFNLNLVKVGSA